MNEKNHIKHADIESLVAHSHQRIVGVDLGDVRINILIRLNSSLMRMMLDEVLATYDLNCVAYFAMVMMHGSKDTLVNPGEVCEFMGEAKANMTRISDDLVDKGLVHRVTNPNDRRRVNLSLTPKGITLLEEVIPKVRARAARVFSVFSTEEKATLLGLLTRLNAALESSLAE